MMTMTWYIRDRYAEFCKVLQRQTVQTLVHRRAQFEDDALQDVQPVQFIVKDRIQWPMAVTHCSSLITNTSYHIEETDAGLRGLSIRELLLK